jgi:hypothetical protein
MAKETDVISAKYAKIPSWMRVDGTGRHACMTGYSRLDLMLRLA